MVLQLLKNHDINSDFITIAIFMEIVLLSFSMKDLFLNLLFGDFYFPREIMQFIYNYLGIKFMCFEYTLCFYYNGIFSHSKFLVCGMAQI